MSPAETILRNVFIVDQGNRLHLVNVHFERQIRHIEYLFPETIPWEAIETKTKRARFLSTIERHLRPIGPQEIDGRFLFLMPGAVDAHVHFDTPGFEFREDFDHASAAAIWGGVTTVIDMPCTSIPAVTSLSHLQIKLQALQNRAFCDYALWGGISGTDFSDSALLKKNMGDLVRAGTVGFKAYLISGMEAFTDLTAEQMRQAALWTKSLGVPLAVHAEDKSLIVHRREQLQKKGRTDWQAYCSARDILAEEKAVSLMAKIAAETRAKVHIVHLSSAKGLEIVRRAQNEGVPLTAETCPHYLFFTQKDFKRSEIRNFLKTAPPVKFEADRDALWQGLAEGTLTFVTTDHAGCDPQKEKRSSNFWQVYGGIPGVEHRVAFILSEGFLKKRLTLERSVQVLSSNPADYYGLPLKGSLQPGNEADLALIDLWQEWTVKAEHMHSKGKYTPFEGVVFGAQVVKTFLRGRVVVDSATNFQEATPWGRFVAAHTGNQEF